MHICVSKPTIIGSDNGLLHGRHQASIWTNSGILLIGPLRTNFSEILIKIQTFSFKKMHFKMLSGKWRPSGVPQSAGLNVITVYPIKDSQIFAVPGLLRYRTFKRIGVIYLPISFWVASLALGQSYPNASGVTLNDMGAVQCQAIIWTNADLLSTESFRSTSLQENMNQNSNLKMPSANWYSFCLSQGVNSLWPSDAIYGDRI